MLGLDGVVKRPNLKLNEVKHTIPTGFNVETVTYRNLINWDIDKKIRKPWRHYHNNIDMLIYVVDSHDMED